MGNTLGQIFRITSFGESHGKAVGVVVDGCPAGMELDESDIQPELDRRRPGQSDLTTSRGEADEIEILSGVFEGKTTGAPIMMMVCNKDAKSEDYANMKDKFRPSHADFTYDSKYGVRDYRGGGRSSARVTLGWVAAGAVAAKYLKEAFGFEIVSYVEQVGELVAKVDSSVVKREDVEANAVRCPDGDAAEKMASLIREVRDDGDTIGGVVRSVIRGVPVGLGEPVFDKLSADLGKAMLSINAVKGFEIGSGFGGVVQRGSEHNDQFVAGTEGVEVASNNSGGVLGGISSGADICFGVAFKPVATLMKEQATVDRDGNEVKLEAEGRHDPCVLPRAVPIVDAMGAIVIMDHYLRMKAVG